MEPLAKTGLSRLKGAPLPWLLIYDNVHEPGLLTDWWPPSGVHVLITTHWSDWHGVAGRVDLEVFSPEISQDYLLKRANSKDKLGAARLAATLEFLPLALDQAGALCKRTGLSFDDYGRRISELIRVKPAGSSYPQSVFGTFNIAIDDAAANCPDAERLLGLLAFLAPDIPLSIIGSAAMDIVDRTRAVEALNAVSLVAIRDTHVRVHRLVQEVMRQRVQENGRFSSVADQHLRDAQKRARGKGNSLQSGMGERVMGRIL